MYAPVWMLNKFSYSPLQLRLDHRLGWTRHQFHWVWLGQGYVLCLKENEALVLLNPCREVRQYFFYQWTVSNA